MVTVGDLLHLYTLYIDSLFAFERGAITYEAHQDAAANFSEAASNADEYTLREFEDRR